MGWLWSSGPAPKGNVPDASADTQTQPASSPEPTYGDPEIAKFMAQIQSEFGGSNSNSTPKTPPPTAREPKAEANPSTSTSSSSSSRWASWSTSSSSTQPTQTTATPSPQTSASHFQTDPQVPGRLDPISESLLPTTMSCRQAFDQAFHCNSLGGQWTSVYRAGTVRSCSEQWDDFWFCMRTRAYSGTVKEEAIKDFYRQKELKRYGPGMPNSTDIWEPRTEKLPAGSAFQSRYEKPDISDEEWRRHEIERRRLIQQMLKEEERRTPPS